METRVPPLAQVLPGDFCPLNTELADPSQTFDIQAGQRLPILIQGKDQYGNTLDSGGRNLRTTAALHQGP